MILQSFKNKRVELFLVGKSFRFSGTFIDCDEETILISSDRDGRLLSFNRREVESIREVLT